MDQTAEKQPVVQLCACRMGLAAGIVWGVFLFLLGILTLMTESYGHGPVAAFGKLYVGYGPGSFGGALLGLIWGFVDAFICVTIVVLIYNAMAKRGACCCVKQTPVGACPPDEQQDQ